jgi:hypothetical protein
VSVGVAVAVAVTEAYEIVAEGETLLVAAVQVCIDDVGPYFVEQRPVSARVGTEGAPGRWTCSCSRPTAGLKC